MSISIPLLYQQQRLCVALLLRILIYMKACLTGGKNSTTLVSIRQFSLTLHMSAAASTATAAV